MQGNEVAEESVNRYFFEPNERLSKLLKEYSVCLYFPHFSRPTTDCRPSLPAPRMGHEGAVTLLDTRTHETRGKEGNARSYEQTNHLCRSMPVPFSDRIGAAQRPTLQGGDHESLCQGIWRGEQAQLFFSFDKD